MARRAVLPHEQTRPQSPAHPLHHTKDAIQAHLTVVTAALTLARHLYQETGITAPKLVKKLIDLQEIDITLPNGQQHTAYPQIDPQTQELLTLLGH